MDILLIEETTENKDLYDKFTTFNITQVTSFEKSKEYLKRYQFDLIVLDLSLAEKEDIDLFEYLYFLKDKKVVVLASSIDLQLREELFRYGILDYILKDENFAFSLEQVAKLILNLENNKEENILIIDDSKIVIKQLKKVLEIRNYNVDFATTGEEGLEKISKKDYSLIILDLFLPDIEGKKILEIIRRDFSKENVPVIVISGNITPNLIRDVLRSGANDFLQKPFVFEEFILKVGIWIEFFKKEKQIEKMAKDLKEVNNILKNKIIEEKNKSLEKDKLLFVRSRHAQMGEIIGMIAHQWKQPLSNISLLSTLIEMNVKFNEIKREELLDIAKKINLNVRELTNIMEDFMEFVKPKREKARTNLKKIFEKARKLLEPCLKRKGVKVEIEVKSLKEISTYENELVQVVVNLLKNAIDAFEERKIKERVIKAVINDKELIISDNAGGIDPRVKDKIFEQYFSTKIQGTGLGLYLSKIVIEEHCGGKIEVYNTKDGASFKISC